MGGAECVGAVGTAGAGMAVVGMAAVGSPGAGTLGADEPGVGKPAVGVAVPGASVVGWTAVGASAVDVPTVGASVWACSDGVPALARGSVSVGWSIGRWGARGCVSSTRAPSGWWCSVMGASFVWMIKGGAAGTTLDACWEFPVRCRAASRLSTDRDIAS